MKDKKILIVDRDRLSVSVLAFRFQQLGLKVQSTRDGNRALSMIRENRPDLVCLGDVDMIGEGNRSLAETLLSDENLETIPIFVVTDRKDRRSIARCQQLGITYFQRSVDTWERLKPIVCQVLSVPQAKPKTRVKPPIYRMYGKVLCVDDDPRVTRSLQLKLREYGLDVIRETNGAEGFVAAVNHRPNVIITEFALAKGSGSYMLGRLRDCEINIPVIFLTSVDEKAHSGLRPQLMNLGAANVLSKPANFNELLAELRRHIALPDELFGSEIINLHASLPAKDDVHDKTPHISLGRDERTPTTIVTNAGPTEPQPK